MYYVTMTDTFLSGWGQAKNKIAKFVNECETLEEAAIVADNARCRTDQKCVNIVYSKPYYNKDRYHVQYKTKTDMPNWYIKDYFKNRR